MMNIYVFQCISVYLYSEKRGWELLSIAASIKAQKLAATAQGNVAVVKESQMSFIISARYVIRFVLFLVTYSQQVWSKSFQL